MTVEEQRRYLAVENPFAIMSGRFPPYPGGEQEKLMEKKKEEEKKPVIHSVEFRVGGHNIGTLFIPSKDRRDFEGILERMGFRRQSKGEYNFREDLPLFLNVNLDQWSAITDEETVDKFYSTIEEW
jgi:hypothetical protein